ncbi:hypothetical protein [Cupriavidus sp. BIC8F]|nr:hypothetical protein [Cupriavidus sp. BIC8F]
MSIRDYLPFPARTVTVSGPDGLTRLQQSQGAESIMIQILESASGH